MKRSSFIRKFLLLAAALCLTAGFFVEDAAAHTKPDRDRPVIRVGCNTIQSYMFQVSDQGRMSGYGYEYLQQLSYYGDWEYEYVPATFAQQLDMLKRGEIDLMVNVSFTAERAKEILYSSAPMGEEIYCLCVPPDSQLSLLDLSTFSGKTIGANEGSYQLRLLRDWVEKNQVDCIVRPTNSPEEEAQLDALVTMNMYSLGDWNPILELGASQYFFAISKTKPELAKQLDAAHRALLEVHPYYSQELQTKYFGDTLLNDELSVEERRWGEENPVIRLGYYTHHPSDHENPDGLEALLDDVVSCMAPHLERYGMSVECVEFSSGQEMESALLNQDIHLMFPAYGDLWQAESRGYMLSSPLYSPVMLIFTRDNANFGQIYDTIAAVREDPFQYPYILEHYPDAQLLYCDSALECLQAVKRGKAGCTVINSQVAESLLQTSSGLRSLSFFTAYNATTPEIKLGVVRGQPELLSLINKELRFLPKDLYQTSISEYHVVQSESALRAHAGNILLGICAVILPAAFLVWRYLRRVKRQAAALRRSNEAIIDMLGTVVEYRSKESGAHIRRVKLLTRVLGEYYLKHFPEYGLTQQSLDVIVAASALHDIGKVAIPDSILLKPGKLTAEEFAEMKTHTTRGAQLLASMKENWNSEYEVASFAICKYHHERFDGKGYPDGLVGDEIPLSAQLVSIVDVYDAMTHKRCYKPSFSSEDTIRMVENGECGVFSPKLLEALRATQPQLEAVVADNPDEDQP